MTSIQFLEDKYFNEYLSEQGIDPAAFISNPLCAIAYDEVNLLDSSTEQNVKKHIFKNRDSTNIELQYIVGTGYESTQCFEKIRKKLQLLVS